jgi:hypothetical protein
MIESPLIIDDCVTKELQDHLESLILSQSGIEWIFNPNTVSNIDNIPNEWKEIGKKNGCVESSQFSHTLVLEGNSVSDLSVFLIPIASAMPVVIDKIFRMKINLKIHDTGLPVGVKDIPHIDVTHHNFLSAIYYVNDADGETYFYNKDGTVHQIVYPKKGRMVIFNGNTLHSAGLPKQTDRAVINMAFTYMEKK